MDTQTRHALKGDRFVQATKSGVTWISGHRSSVMRWTVTAAVVVLVAVGASIFFYLESSAADVALGAALDTYSAPLVESGDPAQQGLFATAGARAKAANQQFIGVAQKYGWLPEGTKAHYFAGITYEELGQNGPAETELKAAAGSLNRNLANLAKRALAGHYRQTGRGAQAVDVYKEIIAQPSETVSAAAAQLDLAELYASSGKLDQARILWAKVKDSDKEGVAGSIAAQKLTGPTQ